MNDNSENIVDNANLWAENQKLQSNWNSLREWLNRQREGYQHARIDIPIVLDKMNELEGDKDNGTMD